LHTKNRKQCYYYRFQNDTCSSSNLNYRSTSKKIQVWKHNAMQFILKITLYPHHCVLYNVGIWRFSKFFLLCFPLTMCAWASAWILFLSSWLHPLCNVYMMYPSQVSAGMGEQSALGSLWSRLRVWPHTKLSFVYAQTQSSISLTC
jgi:hypothetical protein